MGVTAKSEQLRAKPKTSRQNQIPSQQKQNFHGKIKCLTAKQKTSRKSQTLTEKPKTSWQNQKPHGKTKNLKAKPNRATAEVTFSFPVPSYWKGKTKTGGLLSEKVAGDRA